MLTAETIRLSTGSQKLAGHVNFLSMQCIAKTGGQANAQK